jgi:hypothetical protein
MEDLSVSISIPSTPLNSKLIFQLGPWLELYSANLMDTSKVHILPEYPISLASANEWTSISSSRDLGSGTGSETLAIGPAGRCTVELDENCKLVSTLTCKLSVESDGAKSFIQQQRNMPIVIQISPCHLKIELGAYSQIIPFIFPIVGSQNRLRVARKSLYIEVSFAFRLFPVIFP